MKKMTKTISVLLSLCILFGCSKPPKEVFRDKIVEVQSQSAEEYLRELQESEGKLAVCTGDKRDLKKEVKNLKNGLLVLKGQRDRYKNLNEIWNKAYNELFWKMGGVVLILGLFIIYLGFNNSTLTRKIKIAEDIRVGNQWE